MYNRGPILITGGTGFIGSYLAKHLLEQGERVVLFDRNPDPLVREGVSGPEGSPAFLPRQTLTTSRRRANSPLYKGISPSFRMS